MWWLLVFVLALFLGFCLFKQPYSYWTEKGVPQGNPHFIVGDIWSTLTKSQAFADFVCMVYNIAPNSRYAGFYQFSDPTLVIRDPDLMKEITVKDFEHFVDHVPFVPYNCDPLWSSNLFVLNGAKWKEMRATLSPAFTSSKMKFMFELMSKSGQQLIQYLNGHNEDIIILEMKDTLTRFASDVIASSVFGLECDSLIQRDCEFYLRAKEATYLGGFKNMLKFMGYSFFPSILQFFKVSLFSKRVHDFFVNLVKHNIEERERKGIVRPDMIHLLLQARKNLLKFEDEVEENPGFAIVQESEIGRTAEKNVKKEITDVDITSQAIIFIFGGFDTTSALLSFLCYELAVHQDIQDRLYQDISKISNNGGKISYQTLLGMKYLDMVVCETLRKWPTGVMSDRLCTKPYTIEPKEPGEQPLILEKGTKIWIPTYAIHRDAKNFPDPDRFDPERFNDQNKTNIHPYAFLPFGSGPRACIGSRFALLEAKLLFFYILKEFQIIPVEKTQIPLVIDKDQFTLTAEKGIWVGLKKRN